MLLEPPEKPICPTCDQGETDDNQVCPTCGEYAPRWIQQPNGDYIDERDIIGTQNMFKILITGNLYIITPESAPAPTSFKDAEEIYTYVRDPQTAAKLAIKHAARHSIPSYSLTFFMPQRGVA